MPHRFQCRCGTVRGEIDHPAHGVRAACYCGDCQTYAHLLGRAPQVLDALGGTDVVAVHSNEVRLTAGAPSLACLSLSPRGLLRWYASCCNTPIANTPRDWKLPYAGMVHTCLRQPDSLEQSFPEVEARVNTKGAKGKPPPARGLPGMARFAGLVLRLGAARLRGAYKATPFFDAQGEPVAQVVVAPRGDVQRARAAAGQVAGRSG